MTNEQNLATAHRFMEGVLNRGDLALVDEIFDPTFIDRSAPPGLPGDREGVRRGVDAFRRAFPDLHFELADEIADGDKVVSRIVARGTMRDSLFGLPPTGKSAAWEQIHIIRLLDGRILEHWSLSDDMGMLRQLGLAPERAPEAATS
jgi:predicted SnoaL-like aldol condensation-catalyzing enzyme